ncbi:adenine deaminase [Candidatus Contubernalis alkaliaceticus]|uniref:adenine deaminase n=1 Tax=Candidatus Contubernalis alkaliaceticus TaxID=338645 RepID=UPI001F4BDBDE|nr:adenine deaminase [Candidatus Contubernalis alkalaceticus]UNC93311.1 adenine deaminase [Candidatus Contubernalis alkalaceticus]
MDKLNQERWARIINTAREEQPADLLLLNAQVVNVFTGEIVKTNVAVVEDTIAGVGENYKQAGETIDLQGAYLIPGLIDAHIHIESSLLSPRYFAEAALSWGTTAVIADPHEIANVLGVSGVEFMLNSSEGLPVDFFFTVPSCVPATDMETSGARLTVKEIGDLLKHPRVLGLGEMMNFPGVIYKDPEVMEKLSLAKKLNKTIDGHSPGLSGGDLQAYLAAGIHTDHECTSLEEAQEKSSLGMKVIIREGTAARNLRDLLPAVRHNNYSQFLFGSDDLEAHDLMNRGHINHVLKEAVSQGLDPITAVKMATINTAGTYGLMNRGAVAPGYRADLVVVSDLVSFQPTVVIKNGRVVYRGGEVTGILKETSSLPEQILKSVNLKEIFSPDMFTLRLQGEKARVIDIIPDQVVTKKSVLSPKKQQDMILSDPERDVLKIAVVERHRGTGNVGLGLVRGMGLKVGAIASSVAHDSHNIIIVGTNDEDMYAALKQIVHMQGGFAVAQGGRVKASLPLEIAGIMSQKNAAEVAEGMEAVVKAAHKLGAQPKNPFLTMSFLALPVIPSLKLTDRGLVDVDLFQFTSLDV